MSIDEEKIAQKVVSALSGLVLLSDRFEKDGTPKKDYTPADIRAMTGYSATRLSSIRLHGEYYLHGKRLFRREEIDYRRRMGLNLAVEDK